MQCPQAKACKLLLCLSPGLYAPNLRASAIMLSTQAMNIDGAKVQAQGRPIFQHALDRSRKQDADMLGRTMRPEIAIALFWGSFVDLFKTENLGYIKLSDADLNTARDAFCAAIGHS